MKDKWEIIIQNGVKQIETEIEEAYRDKQTDGPWYKIGGTEGEKELNDEERKTLLKNSRDRYWKTPEGRSLIESAVHYIIGKGIVYNADDENAIVQEKVEEFWNHPRNMMELRQKEIIRRALRDGEVFIRYFTDKMGMSTLRFVEPEEIEEIKSSPNDAEDIKSYIRRWTPSGSQTQKEESIQADDMIHLKLGVDMNMARGRPYIESIIKRLIQLEHFIEGRVRKNRIAAGYILEKIVKGPSGTSDQVSSVTGGMTNAATDAGISTAPKRMPKFGSVVVHNEAIEYKWCHPDIKADDCKEDARLIKLSICSGVNAPEYLLSDASNANYASTMVAENPYVRSMEDYQDTFEVYFQMIFRKVIERFIKGKMVPATSTETVMKERRILRHIIPKAEKGLMKKVRELLVDTEEIRPIPTKTSVSIEFPPMIHKELKQDSEAYQIHDAMGWASPQTIASKLGYDFEKEQEQIMKNKEEQPEQEEPESEDEFQKKRDEEIERAETQEEPELEGE